LQELDIRFEAIKRHYAQYRRQILAAPSDDWAIDAYAWDEPGTGIRLSPIEQALWCDIRQQGLVMYPQYPVAGYFVDFANPVAKVAIECDGAAFHVDAAKDAGRQRHIESKGWMVYRISGADCMKETEVSEDEDGRETVTQSPAWNFIAFISRSHSVAYGSRRQRTDPIRAIDALSGWANEQRRRAA
jgi:hypothetical protein